MVDCLFQGRLICSLRYAAQYRAYCVGVDVAHTIVITCKAKTGKQLASISQPRTLELGVTSVLDLILDIG